MGTEILPLIDLFSPGSRAQFRSMGDINMDGIIDQMDLALLRAAWGMTSSNSLWNTPIPDLEADNPLGISILYSDCDIGGYGVVDLKDLGILTSHWQMNIWSWLGWPAQTTIEAGIAIAGCGVAAVCIAAVTKLAGLW
jgi:hypothetical protein